MPPAVFDYTLPLAANGTLQVTLTPPASISGWGIRHDLMYRQNSPQPIVSKYMASGYAAGQSGITLVDGANGVFQVTLAPGEVSGLADGNYAFRTLRTDSGYATVINCGFRLAYPI